MVLSVGCRQDAASAGAEKQRLAAQFEKQLAREVAHKSLAEILRQYGPREPPRYSRCNDLGCILLKMPAMSLATGVPSARLSEEEWVRKAYKRSLAKYHPDKATTQGASVEGVRAQRYSGPPV